MDFPVPDKRWPKSGEPVRVGFRLPLLTANTNDRNGPVDWSDPGNTVTFTAYNLQTGVLKIDAAAATGADGYLQYAWATADTDTAGDYSGFFKVTDGNGKVQHIPRGARIVYKIVDPS